MTRGTAANGWTPEIRRVRLGDEAGISNLIRRAFGLERNDSFWAWWLRGPGPEPSMTRLGLDGKGRVVGMIGANRRQMVLDGDEVPAVLSGDLFIDSHHRSQALYGRLAAGIAGDPAVRASAFLFGVPNAQGAQAGTLAGCRTVGEIQYLFSVLDATPYIVRYLKFPAVARALAGGLNTALRLSRIRGARHDSELEACEIEYFDERFDALWEREKARHGITTVRRADYLNWRYISSPVDYRVIAVETAGAAEVLGYMVLAASEAQGRRMGAMVDCLCTASVPGVFHCLLREAMERFVRRKCHVVRAWALPDSWMYHQLRKYRFFGRASGFFLVVRPGRTAAPGRLLDPTNWYLTQGDSDHIDGDV